MCIRVRSLEIHFKVDHKKEKETRQLFQGGTTLFNG